uniref:Uncharacterized protein n=1 Tax=Sus scrofa TaxID=9823 RepID=A0A480FX02_PIG
MDVSRSDSAAFPCSLTTKPPALEFWSFSVFTNWKRFHQRALGSCMLRMAVAVPPSEPPSRRSHPPAWNTARDHAAPDLRTNHPPVARKHPRRHLSPPLLNHHIQYLSPTFSVAALSV